MKRICISAFALFTVAASVNGYANATPPPSPQAPPGKSNSAPPAPVSAPSVPDEEDADGTDADADANDPHQGTIVQIERDVVYIDLGEKHGVRPGATLRVLRTIIAKHPVTGKRLVDHFPLGQMSVDQVSRVLSFGRIDRRIYGAVKVGDVVRIGPPPQPPRPVEARASAAAANANANAGRDNGKDSAAIEELNRIFELTLGRVPRERAELLASYLELHPNSPYADALRKEIEAFRRFSEVHQRALEAARASLKQLQATSHTQAEVTAENQRNLRRLDILGSLPERIEATDAVDLAVTMRDPKSVQAAFAYVRRRDENAYDRITLAHDGDGYFRARLPRNVLNPPSFEIFIEAIGTDDSIVTAGTPRNPMQVVVDPAVSGPPPAQRNKSELRAFFEYVDFNRFKGNDYYLISEGDFTYRPGTWLAGVTGGFGVMYGRGGKNNDLQRFADNMQCPESELAKMGSPCGQRAGFNYGFFEMEFRFGKWVSLAPRLILGQTVQGPGAGGELKLRIGQYTGTNLQLGVSYFKDFGALGSLHLEWNVVRGWPMGASVIVTNLPAQGDVGVRIVYQIAYRARSFLQPALRIGVAARNIEQIGMSVGLGLIAAW